VLKDTVESIIEVKLSDGAPSKALMHFHEKYNYPAIQLVRFLRHEHVHNNISILDAQKYLAGLFL
jgi:hypothetical protein